MKRVFIVMVGIASAAAPLFSHHGRGATYDDKKIVTAKATITEVAWRNPHVAIYMDIKDETGKVTNWGMESQNVSSLTRIGFFRNTLKVGQEITIKFNPSRAGAPVGVIRKIYDADGKEVLSFGGSIDQ
jgi:Family of unknown function (DUF6152)